jgi:fermentation-respiration switch protein FrsA (DUF1100 family)
LAPNAASESRFHLGRVLRGVALGAPALLGVYWLLLFWVQRSLLFPRPPAVTGPTRPSDAEQVWLAVSGGRVEAWLLPPTRPVAGAAPLLIYTHGNGELIDYWPAAFSAPRASGVAVLLLEYPGYGRSTGSPSESTIREAMVAAYDFALARPELDRRRFIAYGRSLGGGAACLLARERPLAAVVLESTFTSVRAMAPRFAAPGFLVRDPFDNLAEVSRYEGPLLVIHGARDDVIPPEHGKALAAAARRAKLLLLPHGHNDGSTPWPEILQFLRAERLLDEP